MLLKTFDRRYRVGRGMGALAAAAAATLLLAAALDAQSPAIRLQEAFYNEVATLDGDAAIGLYREIAGDGTAPARIRATAQLRLGLCLRLRGDTAGAREAIQTVLDKYPGEEDIVRLARRHLGRELEDDPARFMPPDVLFYIEMVDPPQHVRALSALLEGTPFQNPVDYYIAYLARRDAGEPDSAAPEGSGDASPDAPAQVPPAAAFLNRGFLREMQKIEGLALAVPGDRQVPQTFLGVFLPGESDILRGLVQVFLTLSHSSGVGTAHGFPLLRVPPEDPEAPEAPKNPDEWLHVAIGKDAIIFGRPRHLVEEAVQRSTAGGSSLAANADFRRAQAARAGSFLFVHASARRLAEALRSSAAGRSRDGLESTLSFLGWEHVHSLSAAVSHREADDTLRLALRARLDPEVEAMWNVFRSPPLDASVLPAVPYGALGFFAMRLDDEPPRREALEHLQAALRRGGAWQEDPRRARLVASDAFGRFLEQLDTLVLGVGPPVILPASLRPFAVFRFKNPSEGEAALEDLVIEAFGDLADGATVRSFDTENLRLTGAPTSVRYIEPLPGVRLRIVRSGDVFVVALSPRNFLSAPGAPAPDGNSAENVPLLPRRAPKVLALRPADILRSGEDFGGLSPELRRVFSLVEQASISTLEGKNSLSVNFVVPDWTRTARAILEQLAEMRSGG